MRINNTPLEIDEQKTVVDYLDRLVNKSVVIFSALPNNLYTKSIKQKAKQKYEGLRPGFPDMVIVFKYHVLFLEMKRTQGGKMSHDQIQWEGALKNIGGNVVHRVAYGFDDAKKYIDQIINYERKMSHVKKNESQGKG